MSEQVNTTDDRLEDLALAILKASEDSQTLTASIYESIEQRFVILEQQAQERADAWTRSSKRARVLTALAFVFAIVVGLLNYESNIKTQQIAEDAASTLDIVQEATSAEAQAANQDVIDHLVQSIVTQNARKTRLLVCDLIDNGSVDGSYIDGEDCSVQVVGG